MVPQVEMNGKMVGQEACRMLRTDVTFQGKKVRRIDMGVSETLDGYTTKQGRIFFYFNSHTEFVFPQRSNTHPIYHGIGRYSASSGSGFRHSPGFEAQFRLSFECSEATMSGAGCYCFFSRCWNLNCSIVAPTPMLPGSF